MQRLLIIHPVVTLEGGQDVVQHLQYSTVKYIREYSTVQHLQYSTVQNITQYSTVPYLQLALGEDASYEQ